MLEDKLLFLELAKAASVSFVALLPLVNPVGSAPIFQAFVRQYPRDIQETLARKVALYGLLLLVSSLFLGVKILAFFGISLNVVQVAGGMVIAHTGWELLRHEKPVDDTAVKETPVQAPLTRAFYPLTLPLTVGPGSISTAIGLGAHLNSNGIEMMIASTLGMVVLSIAVWIVYHNAYRLEQLLGTTGTEILNRLSSFVLFALGLQILWNGLAVALRSR
jgi:multiple antibiotic resistance protein